MDRLETGLPGLIREHRNAWIVVAIVTVLRLLLIGQVGLGDDEAYYWEWSRRLSSSYYDHPPVVAWLIAISTWVLGDTSFAVRLPFVLLAVLGGIGSLLICRNLWPDKPNRASWVMVSFHLVPVCSLGAVFAAPDMPMWVCWIGVALAGARAHRDNRLRDWLLLGSMGGLALLCKYTAVFSILGILGWLLSSARGRRQLRGYGPWLGALLSLLVFSPVLIWNGEREWASFRFHLFDRHGHDVEFWTQFGTFVGSQLLTVSPILMFACVAGIIGSPRLGPKRRSWILWQALPVLFVFVLSSPQTHFKAHWTAPAWIVILAFGLGWMETRKASRVWLFGGVGAAAVISALSYVQAIYPLLPIPERDDPTNDTVGWNDVSLALESRCPEPGDCVMGTHMYQIAAQIAFVMPDREVVRLGERRDQYTVWQTGNPGPWNGIWVSHDRYYFDPVRHHPEWQCEADGELPIHRANREVRRFFFWRCRNLGSSPGP